MASTTTRYTIEEFERLPDEMVHYRELVDGELVDVSGNTPFHNGLRDWLIALLLPFVSERKLGKIIAEQEYDFGGNVHGPDVSFFGLEKMPLVANKRRVQPFVPDLAIEIVSANDKFTDLMIKTARYRTCGTAEVWIFDIDPRVAFVQSDTRRAFLSEDDVFETPLIPGFSIRLGDLFDQA